MKADRFWRFGLKRASLPALGVATGALILTLFIATGETAAQYRRPTSRTPSTAPRTGIPREAVEQDTAAPRQPTLRSAALSRTPQAARDRNDVTQMPTVPMPTLARPNATVRSPIGERSPA